MFQLIAIQAAQGTNDDALYLAEMERFRKDHPDDAAGDLVSMDYYHLKKQPDEVLKLADRLDKALGGDPYLSVVRVGALIDAKRFKEARTAAEKAVKDEPKLTQAYWARISVATEEKNHADTLTWLKKLVEDTGTDVTAAEVEMNEQFAAFIKTPQYQQFKQWLAKREK